MTNTNNSESADSETLYQETTRILKEQWRSHGWSEEMASSHGRKVQVIHPVLPGKRDAVKSRMYFIIGKSYVLSVYFGYSNIESIKLFRSTRPLSRNYSFAKLDSMHGLVSVDTSTSIYGAMLSVLKQLPRWTMIIGHHKILSLDSVFELACSDEAWKRDHMVRFLEVAKIQGFTNRDDIVRHLSAYQTKITLRLNVFQKALNAKTKRRPFTHAPE
jgi:hypothetical protein